MANKGTSFGKVLAKSLGAQKRVLSTSTRQVAALSDVLPLSVRHHSGFEQ